jgi:hypothetical protein
LDQIINMKHELVQLAGRIDWDFLDGEIAPLYSDKGRPGIEARFVIGLLLLKHIYGLSDEGVCDRWVPTYLSRSQLKWFKAKDAGLTRVGITLRIASENLRRGK